jgi:uncharacterized protein YndB with AHSA1/START domain
MSDTDIRNAKGATSPEKETDDRATRSIELEQEIDAPPREVWSALTTGEGLKRWFPLDARVDPGAAGSVWLSWGPGMEATAPIHAWEPHARFGWTESYGDDESGRPIRVMVDFHIEGRDGRTVVRLVQSGLGASSDWDEMYDALTDGWTYFLFNLAYYFLRHAGSDRRMVWKRVATDLAREAVWERLLASALIAMPAGAVGPAPRVDLDGEIAAEVASARAGRHWAAALPELADSLFFVEIEGRHVGFWLSTYGVDDDRVAHLQEVLDARVTAALEG